MEKTLIKKLLKIRKSASILIAFLMLLCATAVFGQGRTVTGTVSDEKGEPIIGASVMEKGTANGTVTDVKGKFNLTVSGNQSVLLITYISYHPYEAPVGNQQSITVQLKEDTKLLDEVVVIGYGTVKKRDLTGAVGSIRRKDIGEVSVVSVEQMLQGRVAGVEIINNNGLPGIATSIKIRGVGTIYNADPLYVIDGMPGDINAVSQYDIESIEILKDASSTAIYGARAANGVVLVTTKRGQKGAPRVTLNAYTGIAQVAKKLDMLNASQYIDLAKDMIPGFFNNAFRFVPVSEGGMGMTEEWARTTRSNVQNEIYRTAPQQEYNLNINGGSDNSIYNVSATYTDMDAITTGYNYKRFILMSNTEFTIKKYIKLGQNISFKRRNTHDVIADLIGTLRYAPYMPIEDPNNSWGFSRITSKADLNDAFNPMTDIILSNKLNKGTDINAMAYVDVSLFNDMLKWRTQFKYNNYSGNYLNWTPYRENGNLSQLPGITDGYSYGEGSTVENYLTFNKTFGIHTVNAMIGNTYSSSKLNNGRSIEGKGGPLGNPSDPNYIPWENYAVLLVNRTPSYTVSDNNTWHSAYLSYYGRLNYSLMDRYLFTFNYRQDASPNFAPQNRWGRFPSFAFAWKMEEEGFMKTLSGISQAKLRLSWGRSGNDRIDSYAYMANLYSGSTNNIVAAIGTGQTQFSGITLNGTPATNIRWETSTSYNAGLDMGFLKNSLTASLDVYTRMTGGILVQVPLPGSTGMDGVPYTNAASVRNNGFEFTGGYNKMIGDVSLSISGVLSYNYNNVVSLGQGEPIVDNMVRTEKGHPIASYYGYLVDHVLSTKAEADAYNKKYGTIAEAGDIAFKDIAGPKDEYGNPTGPDGKIDDNDRTFIGQSIPNWTFGLNFMANYRHFDFQLGMSGVAGNNIYDEAIVYNLEGMGRLFNSRTTVLDRWRKEGDITNIPRAVETDPNENRRVSDRYVKDGSFLRLKNMTIGYTVPIAQNDYIDKLRFYVSGQNLYTITKYDGYDPEVGSENEGDARLYNMRRGVQRGGNLIPKPRVFMIGLQATF